jgi:hypothetical protein
MKKGQRSRFCPKGHDKDVTGCNKRGACSECRRISERVKVKKPIIKVQFCPKGHDTFKCGRAKNGRCKTCMLIHSKENYLKNIEKIKERHRLWRETHQEEIKRYSEEHKEEKHQYNLDYYIKNKEDINKQVAKLHQLKMKTDINYRLRCNLRSRLSMAIRGSQKSGSAIKDLGCSIEFLKHYIAAKFYNGMAWNNWGPYWELDHIKPLISFNLSDREQFLMAAHYLNLQPLTIEDHKKKTVKDNLKWRNKKNANRS